MDRVRASSAPTLARAKIVGFLPPRALIKDLLSWFCDQLSACLKIHSRA